MGGLYDLLETYRIQNDPRFAYEGLYQDPMKPKNNVYDYYTYDPDASPYGGATMYNDIDNLQPYMSSSFPQEFGVGSLFDPRVGKSRQSIYFNEPSLNAPQDFYQPIGDPFQTDYPATRTIQEEDEDEENQLPYSGVGDMRYQTPRTIADQNRILGQTFTEEEPSGIAKLFKTIGDIYNMIPSPLNLMRSIGDRIEPYQQFSPGTTIRNGIVSVAGVNTPYSAFGGDFYNPNTGLNRFDRARNRFNETRSLKDLFGASRTLAEFNNARKILDAQKKSGYKSNFMNRPKSERNFTGPSGGDNTGGDKGAKGAADSFSNKSGMGRTGY